jgi:hypothetical protein
MRSNNRGGVVERPKTAAFQAVDGHTSAGSNPVPSGPETGKAAPKGGLSVVATPRMFPCECSGFHSERGSVLKTDGHTYAPIVPLVSMVGG